MKSLFNILPLLAVTFCSYGQNANNQTHRTGLRFIGKDSVILSFNENYDLVGDSCAEIIRHGHINAHEQKFTGKFKDAARLDPSVVLAEGNYTGDRLKNGLFITHYLNGKLRSKGVYKNNRYTGRWEAYYEDGKPQLIFEATNDTIKIVDAWDTKGKKTIDNGKGAYLVNLPPLTWKGKLENGRPEGTWHAFNTDDITQTSVVTEYFKKGGFQNGKSQEGKYTNAPRLMLIGPRLFSYVHAEKLYTSAIPCNGLKRKHIVNAQYYNKYRSFDDVLKSTLYPYFSDKKFKNLHGEITIDGVISEKGILTDMKASRAFGDGFSSGLMRQLGFISGLRPATADGKPIKQNFTITFSVNGGVFSFDYEFLPIHQDLLK